MLCDAPKWLGEHLGEQARVYGKTFTKLSEEQEKCLLGLLS
jgi:hypothetical protein